MLPPAHSKTSASSRLPSSGENGPFSCFPPVSRRRAHRPQVPRAVIAKCPLVPRKSYLCPLQTSPFVSGIPLCSDVARRAYFPLPTHSLRSPPVARRMSCGVGSIFRPCLLDIELFSFRQCKDNYYSCPIIRYRWLSVVIGDYR